MGTQFHTITSEHSEQALGILEHRHNRLRSDLPWVPSFDEYPGLENPITDLFQRGQGVVATRRGKLIGYMAGYPVDHFFGNEKGVYCPLFGLGLSPDEGELTIGALYEEASRVWVENRAFTHGLTIFSQETEERDGLFWSGFGLRCVDAMAPTTMSLDTVTDQVEIVRTEPVYYQKALQIHREHHQYYRSAPIFMPNKDFDYEQEQADWNAIPGNVEWLALKDGEVVGMTRISNEGETYISQHRGMRNIKDTYVSPGLQKTGVGKALLATVFEHLRSQEIPLCGVDFETINPKARRFWLKVFQPYTFSLVRRVDERIAEL